MQFETLRFEVDDGVAVITLDRPERMNAFNWKMGAELGEAYTRCDEDDAIRAVVLTGAGRAFCAGADMSTGDRTFEGSETGATGEARRRSAQGVRPFEVRKPVVAAINGHAIGVGLTMTMQCDLRFVAEDAKLAFAFVRRGIIPELASHSILPRVVGLSNAADLLLSGRTFRGREAAEMGLASRALPADEVLPAALAWAREVAVNAAPASVAIAKRLMWEGVTESPIETMRKETPLFAWVGRQKDAVEGVKSFLEKRAPEFTLRPSRDLPDWPGEESGT